jgi:hypothetical protein
MKTEIYLAVPSNRSDLGGFTSAVTLGQGWPTQHTVKVGNETKQVPITYLDKDVIEEGEYVHPKTGQKVHATRQQLMSWKKKFDEMTMSGALEPTVPCDHRVGSKDNLGFVKAARLHEVKDAKGKTKLRLNLTHALIGEDAPVLALRNRASLGIDPDFTDGKGKNWGSVIIHSAITPDPVVSGMGGFASTTMLSRGEQVDSMYLLSAQQESNMKAEHKKMLCKHLGMEPSDSMSDDDLMSMVDKEMSDRQSDMDGMAKGVKIMARAAGAEGEDFDSTVENTVEKIKLSRAAAEQVNLSRNDPEIDDDTAFLLSNSFNTEMEAAVMAGGVDSATAGEVQKILVVAGKPTKVALSRIDGENLPVASRLWNALKNNKPVPANSTDRTGNQHRLSRETPNAGSDAETKAAVRERMIAKANGVKPAKK